MENNSRGGNVRRERRPRIGSSASSRPSEGNGRVFSSTDRPRRSFGDNNGERKSFGGERRSFNSERRSFDGERRSFNGERRSYDGERRSFDGERRSFDGERRSFNGERRSFNGNSNRSYGQGGERRPYNGGSRSYGQGGERRPYNGGSRSFGQDGERRPYNGGSRSFGQGGERRPYNGGSRSFGQGGERRSYNGGSRSFGQGGDRRSFNGGQKRGGFNNRQGFRPYREEDESGINKMLSRKPMIDENTMSDNDYVPTPIKEEVRLNKFIANSGMCSRREADNFIQAGVVTVNGEIVTELGTKVNVLTDDVRFNGERLKGEEKVYIVMNKPKGFVTTASDPHADKTVMDLLTGCPARVFPVGRLDKNTTGVLMFTNDGEMAEKLTHPSYNKKKIYQVTLDNKLKQEDFDKILAGVTLQDGDIAADDLEYIDENDHRKLGIEIHSGKNRIVRRIFESLGYEVKALDRVYFAGLTKKNVKKGQWRFLTEGEVNVLKMGAYL